MPPKKNARDPGPPKVKIDATFGLKNKNKSAKVQQQVKVLQQQDAQKGKNKEVLNKEKEKAALLARKEADKRKKDEEALLFVPIDIVQAKVPFGVDPKTVLCAFFKAGRCQKGTKCKYSHNLDQDRRQTKASIYADQREGGTAEKEADTMDKWNDEKLQEVVGRKAGVNAQTTTDIVCKHFIDAVETGRYGWFWECPDGGDACKYRHALPPGFVLKSQQKKEDEAAKKKEITIEEFLEVERHKLDPTKLTPLTPATFATWKKNRMDRKQAQAAAEQSVKSAAHAMGKNNGMSGRDLFTFNPDLMGAEGDEDEGDEDDGWDLEALREERQKEDKAREEDRMRRLENMFGDTSLEDAGPS